MFRRPQIHPRPSRSFRLFFNDDRGMSTVEYVILLVVLVVGAVKLWQDVGGHVQGGLSKAESELETLSNGN